MDQAESTSLVWLWFILLSFIICILDQFLVKFIQMYLLIKVLTVHTLDKLLLLKNQLYGKEFQHNYLKTDSISLKWINTQKEHNSHTLLLVAAFVLETMINKINISRNITFFHHHKLAYMNKIILLKYCVILINHFQNKVHRFVKIIFYCYFLVILCHYHIVISLSSLFLI